MKEDIKLIKEIVIENLITKEEKEKVLNKEYTITIIDDYNINEMYAIISDTKSFNASGKDGYVYQSKIVICKKTLEDKIIDYSLINKLKNG